MSTEPEPLLKVSELSTGYQGDKEVLRNVTFEARRRQVVAVIGHNGAGKSTLLKAIFGLLPLWQGRVSLNGVSIGDRQPGELLRMGIVYVPQGNRVFRQLTVGENLKLAAAPLGNAGSEIEAIDRALTLFPELGKRIRQRAATLSGGEKQMLALANGLVLQPTLLLLDEPSLGLAPKLVSSTLHRVRSLAKTNDLTVLVVEQKVRQVLEIADRALVLRSGKVTFNGESSCLSDSSQLRSAYL